MRAFAFAVLLVASSRASASAADVAVLGDFDRQVWPGVTRSAEQRRGGRHSGKWAHLEKRSSIRVPYAPKDWSRFDRLTFWLYSSKANGQKLTIVCDSDNPKDKEGWDYFFYHFRVDWQGWRFFDLRLGRDIRPTRRPKGWQHINYLSFNASGWHNVPLPDTVLFFNDVKLVRDIVRLEVLDRSTTSTPARGRTVTCVLRVTNRSDRTRRFALQAGRRPDSGSRVPTYQLPRLPARTDAIASGAALEVPVRIVASAEALRKCEPLAREAFVISAEAEGSGDTRSEVVIEAAAPLPRRAHPFLFATRETIERAKARAEKYPWARAQIDSVLRSARRVLQGELNVPDEPGQWGHHYVCKKCGHGLVHKGGKHVCRKCGEEYKGWPYDQVVVARVHSRDWRSVRTLGLAYAFSGNESFAQRAKAVLLAYADKYAKYPIHNTRGKASRSGARVFAQTLDESVGIIGVAWGYDLIYNSPCLGPADREKIETGFLRQVVETVRRYDAGISNWQSWHNAGIAAVGFCLQDAEIAALAINGKSGLRFQLRNSVLSDGFWYEGAVAYHYYALDALRYTTEAARLAGLDFYGDASLKSLFDAPPAYVFPDCAFPAVNDSDVFSIKGRHALYDLAYARFQDPRYLDIAHSGRRRSLEALLWGVDELPAPPGTTFGSRDFSSLGAVVLRQGQGPDQWYVHLDYGPHGGGHGHPDKLALIIFALGRELAPDPGRLAYAAPLHRSWYRQTFAHNTVCVDEKSQAPATGKLTMFHAEAGFAVAQAECSTAYKNVLMRRALALTGEYLIDVFDLRCAREHTYDWVYHNFGELTPGLATTRSAQPLARSNGYQHLRDIAQARTQDTWSADFLQPGANVRVMMAGAKNTMLYFGNGMARRPPRPCPMLVARREGRRTTYVAVIEPYRDKSRLTGVRTLAVGDDAVGIEIVIGGRKDFFMLAERAGVERTIAGFTTTARCCWVRTGGSGVEASRLAR